MGINVQANKFDQVDSTQQFPLGELATIPGTSSGTSADKGKQEWIYVYNDSGNTIDAGMPCMRKAGTETYRVLYAAPSTDPARIVGVAQHSIATGKYAWIVRDGRAEVLAGTGGITADSAIIMSTTGGENGKAKVTGGITAASFGLAIDTAAAGSLATCIVHCHG